MTLEHQSESTQPHSRKRTWLLLISLLGLPVLAAVGWMWSSAPPTHAQFRTTPSDIDRSLPQRAVVAGSLGSVAESGGQSYASRQLQPASPLRPGNPLPIGTFRNGLGRPVIETSYREESYTVLEPVIDRRSGETTMKQVTKTRRVPVQTTRFVAEQSASNEPFQHDPKVFQIINELRDRPISQYSTAADEQKLSEVRALLQSEFDKKHQQQAEEIAETEKRIGDLKARHEQRGENRELIINRRIDQLLGKANPLDWDVSTPRTIQRNPYQNSPALVQPHAQSYDPPDADTRTRTNADRNNQFSLPRRNNVDFQTQKTPRDNFDHARDSVPQALIGSQPLPTQSRDNAPDPLDSFNNVFAVIKQLGEATLAEQSTNSEMERVTKLRDEGVLPQHKFRQANLAHETAKQRAAILNRQLTMMQSRLQTEVEIAQEQLLFAREQAKAVAKTGSDLEKTIAKRNYRRAELDIERANRELAQYNEAVKKNRPTDTTKNSPAVTDDHFVGPEDKVGSTGDDPFGQ